MPPLFTPCHVRTGAKVSCTSLRQPAFTHVLPNLAIVVWLTPNSLAKMDVEGRAIEVGITNNAGRAVNPKNRYVTRNAEAGNDLRFPSISEA